MEPQPEVAAPVRRGGIGVDQFFENLEPYTSTAQKIQREIIGRTEEVCLYVLDRVVSRSIAGAFYETMIDFVVTTEDSNAQLCAYALSALNVYFPMGTLITSIMQEMNWRVTTISYPSGLPTGMELAEAASPQASLESFAQLVLIMFRNISDVNYYQFMTRRIQAIRSFIAEQEGPVNELAIELDRAKIIRRGVGGDVRLRKEILVHILTAREKEGPLGRLCAYLSGILSWTDMSYLVFIYDELVLPSSPVLAVTELANEVRNAIMALLNTMLVSHPQYFRLLVGSRAQKVLDRSRFPTLIEVARKLRAGRNPSMNQFQGSAGINQETITSLLALHRSKIKPVSDVYVKQHNFLLGKTATSDGYSGLLNRFVMED